jgi:SRSO17 transposase
MVGSADDEEAWLLVERAPRQTTPPKFWLASLPRCTTLAQLVHLVKERHRTERVLGDLKEELGLDHFEGRTYRGWHHHVTVALACYAFVVSERVRRSCPPRRREAPFLPALDQTSNDFFPRHPTTLARQGGRSEE